MYLTVVSSLHPGRGTRKTPRPVINPLAHGVIRFCCGSTLTLAIGMCKSIPVYNCTTSSEMSITWNQFLELGRLEYMQCPSLDVIWYPGGSMHSSLLVHLVCFMCLQMIPAIIFDAALFFTRRKPW
uniref:Uncharacterized protein n=1 Tax=Timema monikensis TaxID=170555 RepID=A0A7R9EKF2_9NEOP|nr:unnamed protein product [Timema monikensis]